MKRITTYILTLATLNHLALPVAVAAITVPLPHSYSSPVIITELQTGAAAASDEFVEIANVSQDPVDITGWQIRYQNAATASGSSLLGTVVADDGSATILLPGGYYVFHTGLPLPPETASQVYSTKLSSTDKAVGLFAPDPQTCQMTVRDAIAWGVSMLGEGRSVPAVGAGDKHIQRYVDAAGSYIDSDDNAHDVSIQKSTKDTTEPMLSAGATPGLLNTLNLPDEATPATGSASQFSPLEIDGCSLPQEEDDPGLVPPDEEPPAVVEDQPTDETASGRVAPTANKGLKSPQLTELLPNPGKPRTDAADEFVELYNSNEAQFDLSGFAIAAGTGKTKKKYAFPQGAILPGKSFKAYFSADTHLTLSNTEGLVQLLDPFGNVISSTDVYSAAKDDQAWALAKGVWQWTTKPTPGSANHVVAPVAKTTAKKGGSTSIKSASLASKNTAATAAISSQNASEEEQKPGLHIGVLALVGVFALLYGAYEYRSDVANKIHQFRIHRTARREARQGLKGR
ncbi:MAG TPA: lamin tail domain-containing protein [Candidatus Saccharimonadales bacterium]|nr:lamin tail domain-containing protein [Candidatus Saccharimonadales bacterium]